MEKSQPKRIRKAGRIYSLRSNGLYTADDNGSDFIAAAVVFDLLTSGEVEDCDAPVADPAPQDSPPSDDSSGSSSDSDDSGSDD